MKSLIIAGLVGLSAAASAQISPEWIRYASISPNGEQIAFTYKGDLYRVAASGGEATRLTYHKSHDYMPVWSNNGESLAFASNRHGNFDVFIMSAKGGSATRLTFDSSNETPYSFSKDDAEIYFSGQRMDTAEHRQFPTGSLPELYKVNSNGGRVSQVLTSAVESLNFNNNGSEMVYQDVPGTENRWRKHHKSTAARDIWRYNLNTQKHQQLTQFEGEDRNPVYTNDNKSIFYLSEKSGSFNVHKMGLGRSSKDKQLTKFSTHPVRFLSKANRNGEDLLAFTQHGRLYTMVDGGKPERVNVSIRTQDAGDNIEIVGVDGDISEMAISPDGKEIAFISNGEVFVSSSDGKFTKQITSTPAQERFVSFSAEGDYLIYAAERDNKWSIYKTTKVREEEPFFYAATLLKEDVLLSNKKDNYLPKLSPDGKSLAFVEDRRTLKVLNLESNKSKTLVKQKDTIHMRDGDQEFSWSPDSKWILFQYDKLLNNSDIALIDVANNKPMRVVIPSGYYDSSPKWANDGKQIMWFSNRNGLKSYATSGTTENDVYALFLDKESWDEFNLSEEDYELAQAIEEANEEAEESEEQADDAEAEASDAEEAVDDIVIDWDGLDERIAKLTIHSSKLSDAVLNKDATKLYYLTRFERGYDLWETDIRTRDTSKIIRLGNGGGSLQYDADMDNLYLLSGGSIMKLKVDEGSSEGIYISKDIEIDKKALFEHAFNHVWLRTSKVFYEPSYHGIDWDLMYKEYSPKVAHIGNSREFTELLSEMLGELNVSHSGAGFRGGSANGDSTASLGIFYDHAYTGNGIKITEVVSGGPLDKAKLNIKPGMIITEIDGKEVGNDQDWAKLLNRKAYEFTLLTVTDGKKTSQVTVKPISKGELGQLLYKRFVKLNEEQVAKQSKGKLGYVHIPGMGDGPYRSMFNDIMGKYYGKKGIVIDTRFNGGGDLVADLAMFFTGESFLTYETEDKVVGGEPTSRYTKPVVTLFNQAMYSDGHCYASGWTDLKLGKSIGVAVPGTCSFAGWEGLPTGGYWGVVPVSAKNKAGEWLENNQTAPDIVVENDPEEIGKGRDQQLERAIKELLKEVR